MKKNIIFSIVFLVGMLLAAQSLLAQAGKYQRQIHIDEKGEVSDDKGTRLGYISKEDIVFDNEGTKLGFIKNGKVYNAEGKLLGKAKKNGRYYSNDGALVLNTTSDGEQCEILDPEGHKLGMVHKNYKIHACAAHCFFKEEKLKESEGK